MAGRGSQTFQKRQKEQQRKEKQQEKLAKRLSKKENGPAEEEELKVLDGPPKFESDEDWMRE